jgi:hypothetical protein
MKRLLILFFIIICINSYSIAQESVINSYNKADSIFCLVKNRYKYAYLLTYKRFYSGKEYLRGHFYKPNAAEVYDVSCEYEYKDKSYSIESIINYNGTPYTAQYKFDNDKDSCAYNEYGDSKIKKKSYGNIFEYFSDPINILYNIFSNKPSLHLVTSLDPKYYILGFNDKLNNKYYVYINTKTHLIEQLCKLFYDENYGNSYEKIIFENYTLDEFPIPQRIRYFIANNIKKDLTLNNVDNIQFSDKSLENIDYNEFSFILDTIAKETYLIKFMGLENKVLVLKDKDYLSVFEAPVNPIVSSKLIKYLDEKFNGLRIKYLYLTHHHPDHAAGIKAFADIGCAIIAPKLDILYLDSLVHIQHSLNNYYDIYKKNTTYKLIEKNTKILLDKGEVIAYEVGENTGHSESFILYYLPFSNVLFTSDLVFFSNIKIKPQSKRAYSIYELIKNEKIKISDLKLIPSFLISNYKDIGTYSDLIDCLKENYPDVK